MTEFDDAAMIDVTW